MTEDSRRTGDFGDISTPSSGSASTLIGGFSPQSPARHRPGYHRLTSAPTTEDPSNATIPEVEGEHIADTFRPASDRAGLRIVSSVPSQDKHGRKPSIPRVPVGSRDSPLAKGDTPTSPPIASPSNARNSTFSGNAYAPGAYGLSEDASKENRYKRSQSTIGTPLEPYQSDSEQLTKHAGAESVRSAKTDWSAYDHDFQPNACPSTKSFYQGRSNWLAVSILTLAIFSTVFSGIYLGIALRAPRWGRTVRSNGALTASTANVLAQLFAKLIELSFVTVFVAFLGQVLSRRAFSRQSRGVTLAEMSMRNWIMQPGSIFTHYESVRFAALTFLGVVSLTVAVMAMLYTTAATALVAPVLKFGDWENRLLSGVVKTSFANPNYLSQQCQTPIQSNSWDLDYSAQEVGSACIELEHAAQGFHNYQRFMGYWTTMVQAGNGSTNQTLRPEGFGLFLENTTVNGSWINTIDTKTVSSQFNRAINNVTLAMPHTGVFQAARDSQSNIMQPEDLDGLGAYTIRAAVPSPYINVICANMQKAELKDLVYESSSTNITLRPALDLPTAYTTRFNWTKLATLKTPVDDVFEWNENNRPPVFYKYPMNFNTLLNNTFPTWGRDSIYLLGKGGPNMNQDYVLCKAKAGTTPFCSTHYMATSSGGMMSANCEDPTEDMTFFKGNTSRATTTSLDWYNVATTTFNSLSLNNGVVDGNASNARVLTQLILQDKDLNSALPSPAEALAVMVSCSLLMSSEDSPFVEFWNYSLPALEPGAHQTFNASIRAQQYASGGSLNYQRGFYIVLFAVFFTNVFVLVYFMLNKGLVTDFSEPPNLFSIAINSPPSKVMGGSCGGGPVGRQYQVNWGVSCEHEHLFIADRKDAGGQSPFPQQASGIAGFFRGRGRRRVVGEGMELYRGQGGVDSGYTIRTEQETDYESTKRKNVSKPETSLGRMYSKFSKRRSIL